VENLEEIDKFLGTYEQPKLNQENIDYLNGSLKSNETEAAIKSLAKGNNGQYLTDSLIISTRPFEKKLMPTLLKLFQEIEREGTLPKSFYEVLHSFQNQTRTQQKKRIIGQSLQ
jgi:hypothetical protein